MTEKLWRLLYLSRNEIEGSSAEVLQELEQILATARRHNAAMDICGALMFNREVFAQALEGPQRAVLALFDSIQQDRRHSNVVVLGSAAIDKRTFKAWSMGYVGVDLSVDELFGVIGAESGFTLDDLPAEHVFEILRSHLFKAEMKRLRWKALRAA